MRFEAELANGSEDHAGVGKDAPLSMSATKRRPGFSSAPSSGAPSFGLIRSLDEGQSRMQSLPDYDLPDFSGRWRVVHDVQTSARPDYVGLTIEFDVNLVQFGGSLVGTGEKARVDNSPVEDKERSLLEVSGRVESDGVRLSLFERLASCPSRNLIGEIVWRPENPDHMVGRFEVDVGQTHGTSQAFRRGA
jgi:hypothetical protein